MKRCWFRQQKQFDYMPLRAGLGLISEDELKAYWQDVFTGHDGVADHPELCPKIFTTRTHRLKGRYYVVEGSRYNSKLVDPEIVFEIGEVYELNLRSGVIRNKAMDFVGDHYSLLISMRYPHDLSFPELDIGVRGTKFEDLQAALLKLNPKATIDTPFYIHKLEPVGGK